MSAKSNLVLHIQLLKMEYINNIPNKEEESLKSERMKKT